MDLRKWTLVGAIILAILAVLPVGAAAYSYNRQAAVNYALANAYNDVPGSWYFKNNGGDCTNFVSWSLKTGGWVMRGPEYGKQYEWYMYGNPWPYSTSWTSVKEFGEFAKYRGYQLYLGDNIDTIKSRISYWVSKGEIQKGDIIQRLLGGPSVYGHTMIVTEVSGDTVRVTYHTPNTKNQPFNDFLSINYKTGDQFVAYHLLDSFSY